MHYIEVAPIKIIRQTASSFTYASETPLDIGQLVKISVGKQLLVGVVISHTDKPLYDVKPVNEVLQIPPLPAELLKTAQWISEFYYTHFAVVLQTLLPSNITTKRRKRPVESVNSPERTHFLLTEQQASALNTIRNTSAGLILLHGITGSGKTRVYIETIRETLATNKSAILLVPEISLTAQLHQEFLKEFDNVVLTHSHQTEAERHIAWQTVAQATTPLVIIGPRSALFLPCKSLGVIIIDECHEPSYKQEKSPRYSAVRVASTLAKHHSARLILGSATPSIEDYYLATHHHHPIITMNQLATKNAQKPNVILIDMKKRDSFLSHRFFSNQLLQSITENLKNHTQTLIFHNRRGTALVTLCEKCGWQAGCSYCFIPLTLHADTHTLKCHVCNRTSKVPSACPECSHASIIHKGIGTKQIEQELTRLFPKARIARFDGDTLSDSTVEKRYTEIVQGDIDIIIGTQIIAKGLDLPKLRTVGIVQADTGLHIPDYSSAERTFQLLSQAIGRVGRFDHSTTVIVQTFSPNHPAIKDSLTQNYTEFYERTIALRKHTNFPPFVYLLKLVCSYKTEQAAIKNAKKLAETFKKTPHVEVLGPTPAFYERERGNYRWQLVVKSSSRDTLKSLLAHVPPKNWQAELDPTNLL